MPNPYSPPEREPALPTTAEPTGLAGDRSFAIYALMAFMVVMCVVAGIRAYRSIRSQTVVPRPKVQQAPADVPTDRALMEADEGWVESD